MTLNQLKKLCSTWQERLRIKDWAISIRWSSAGELPHEYGTTEYDPRQMAAEIILRPGNDPIYPDGGVEQTLIHELLHVVMHGDTDYEKENIMQERAINQIADALYYAYLPKKRKK